MFLPVIMVVFGSVPDWIAAVGTVCAFFATWWAIMRSTMVRHQELILKQWDEASLVTHTPPESGTIQPDGVAPLTLAITNGGRFPVSDVSVLLRTEQGEVADSASIGLISAQARHFIVTSIDSRTSEGELNVDITWTDIADLRWVRSGSGAGSLRTSKKLHSGLLNLPWSTQRTS